MTQRFLLSAAVAALLSLPALATDDGTFEKTLEVGSAVDLVVGTDSGGITVKTGDDGEVRVVGHIRRSRGWFNTAGMEKVRRIEQNPPILHQGSNVRLGRAVKGFDQKGISISYEIWTPENTRLNSTCDSGGTTVEGIRGPVVAECDSGGIRVRDIGGDVTLEVDSGRIEADGVDGNLTASADSGGIRAKGIRGQVTAETDSGGIEIEQIAPADIEAKADSGGIRVTVPKGAGYDLVAETDSGGINVEPAVTVTGKIKKNHIVGKIGPGGHQFRLETDSGGIRIYEGGGEI